MAYQQIIASKLKCITDADSWPVRSDLVKKWLPFAIMANKCEIHIALECENGSLCVFDGGSVMYHMSGLSIYIDGDLDKHFMNTLELDFMVKLVESGKRAEAKAFKPLRIWLFGNNHSLFTEGEKIDTADPAISNICNLFHLYMEGSPMLDVYFTTNFDKFDEMI